MSASELQTVLHCGGTRIQLEYWVCRLGYIPEDDDTDADLRVVILNRR